MPLNSVLLHTLSEMTSVAFSNLGGGGAALINKNIGIAFCRTVTGMLKIKHIIMLISLQLIFET